MDGMDGWTPMNESNEAMSEHACTVLLTNHVTNQYIPSSSKYCTTLRFGSGNEVMSKILFVYRDQTFIR